MDVDLKDFAMLCGYTLQPYQKRMLEAAQAGTLRMKTEAERRAAERAEMRRRALLFQELYYSKNP